jgi:hypothetical protein
VTSSFIYSAAAGRLTWSEFSVFAIDLMCHAKTHQDKNNERYLTHSVVKENNYDNHHHLCFHEGDSLYGM